MLNISLSQEQKSTLELRHKKSRDKRECDRIKAVLLSDEGWSVEMIAQALRIHETSISRHINDFIKTEKLTPQSGGSDGYLNEAQTTQLIEHLCDVTYLHTHQIVAYIKASFNIEYSVSGLNKWLHQHRFSYKQPKGVPHKFDVEKQNDFIKFYDALKESLKDDEPLLFMDAVHPTQATKITAGWIRKGVDKPIETTGSRTRLNIVGAIRLGYLGEAVIEQYEKTVNGESIIDFFTKVRGFYPHCKSINLVLDGAGYHRSKDVKAKAEELNIILHYLPP
ncbi:IS630 family transposase, partial [Psychromonas sp. MB-3u-54]|uniref:IS630 family transposase n=1 Tax=Psychromonas sp. MB-3u-54 TaxID=2058319 RepID=UPI000C347D00